MTFNRFTQRQSVHLPIMAQFIQTLLSNVDDFPVIHFENLNNDKDAEIFKNAYWDYTVIKNNMTIKDIVDKKQVFLFGRTFDQWQIMKGRVHQTICDPMDISVSRYVDPTDLHSSRFLNHGHIFVPLSSLENNENYNQEAIVELKKYYQSQEGEVKVASNIASLQEKQQKMADMGDTTVYDPLLGETYVELDLQFVFREGETYRGRSLDNEIVAYVEAEDQCILMKEPLETVIGPTKDNFWRTHYPYESWADDVDRQDFWTNGRGDMIRTPNKIIDSMFAQEVENRTLKNFNMKYYDATKDDTWQPPTNQPLIPGGWYGLPGNPNEVFKLNEVANLGESLPFIEMIKSILEQATGSTPQLQGSAEQKQITLGQFQGLFSEAKNRVQGMSKFYTPAWERRGMLFEKLCEAAPEQLDAIQIHKKGRNTDAMFTRDITPDDWQTPLGYVVKVWSQDEKDQNDEKKLQKLEILKAQLPMNKQLNDISIRKKAEWAGLSPEEINAIMEEEKQNQAAILASGMNPALQPPVNPAPAPKLTQGLRPPGLTA